MSDTLKRRAFILNSGKLLGAATLLSPTLNALAAIETTNIPVNMGQPCRNFNIMARAAIVDPIDGKEKMVLSNYADGEIGSVIIIDIENGKGEQYFLPAGPGAWGLVCYKNEKLIIGTCVGQAYLHVFDLRTRKFTKTIESKGEAYFWQIAFASDGKVYGGTYPGCSLTQFDPETEEFKNLGRVSDDPSNQYSKIWTGMVPGYVLISYGYNTKGIKRYHVETGVFDEWDVPAETEIIDSNETYIATKTPNGNRYYNSKTFELLPESEWPTKLKRTAFKITNEQWAYFVEFESGRLAGTRGQDFYVTKAPETWEDYSVARTIDLKPIPVEAPPTTIMSMTTDKKGNIWGASSFGLTIYSIDPKTGKYWNSPALSTTGGEVYGMVFAEDGKLHLSAYVGGELIVYDPTKPWDQLNNVNPKTLKSLAPALIRPEGKSVMGPDNCVYTGWSGRYGQYAGGLSRVNPQTLEVSDWFNPIPDQQLAGIAADKHYVYFTTNGGASGLAYNNDARCHFAVWDTKAEKVIYKMDFDPKEVLNGSLCCAEGMVYFATRTELLEFNPKTLAIASRTPINFWTQILVPGGKNRVFIFSPKLISTFDTKTKEIKKLINIPMDVRAAIMGDKRTLYYNQASTMYKLTV